MDTGTIIALIGLGAFAALLAFFYFYDRRRPSKRPGSQSYGGYWSSGVSGDPGGGDSGGDGGDSGGGGA